MAQSEQKRRWKVAATAAVVVAILASICTWQLYRGMLQIPDNSVLQMLQNSWVLPLAEFRAKRGVYPKSLDDLAIDAERIDPWGTPLEYENLGDNYRLVSKGADKARGGVGVDSDIEMYATYDLETHFSESKWLGHQPATYWQFLSRQATPGMLAACGVAGLCTFLAGFIAHRPVGLEADLAVPATVAITGVVSILAAMLMAGWHVPIGEHH